MDKVKCECINCGWVQHVPAHDIQDCERCGSYINSDEDTLDEYTALESE